MALDVGELRASLRLDDSPFRRTLRSARDVLGRFGSGFGAVKLPVLPIAKFTAYAAAAHAASVAVSAVAALAPVAGAGLAALPGLALGGATAFGVFKVATLGFSDALKEVSDPARFAEAVAKLSPAARGAATAVQGLVTGPLRQLQLNLQETFFQGVAPAIRQAGAALLSLRPEAGGVAAAFSGVARQVLTLGASQDVIGSLKAVMAGVRDTITGAAHGITPLIIGFTSLARQAGEFGGQLGHALGDGLATVGRFLDGVDLAETLGAARAVLTPLIALVGNLGTILFAVFEQLGMNGADALGVVGSLVATIAGFVKSDAGAEALGALGEAIRAVAGGAALVLVALLQQVAPLMVELAPVVSALATGIAGVLVPAIEVLGPALAVVVGGLVTLLSPILQAPGLMQVLVAGVIAWTVAQWALNVALTANPIGLIIVGIGLLVAAIVWVATKTTWFQQLWAAVWGFLKGVGHWFANDFVQFFVSAYNWIGRKGEEFRSSVVGQLRSIVDFVTGMPGRIRAAAAGMFQGIVDSFRGAINWLISLWNRLDLSLSIRVPEPLASLVGFSGVHIPDIFPDIPYLAEGGIIPATPGGRLARLAEGGQDEAVMPLSALDARVERAVTRALGARGVRTIRFEVGDQFRTWMREDVHAAGGVDSYFSPVR